MISMNLQGTAEVVIRQAQRQGFVLPRDIRAVLSGSGLSESLWKDVVAVARPILTYRKGRYYYTAPVSDRVRQQQSQQANIKKAVQEMIRRYQAKSAAVERREEERISFVQTVRVRADDEREYTMLSRDLSATGIRLIGTRRFLGQKIRVSIPASDDSSSWDFVVRVLWTCAVGEDLVENGGTFVELSNPIQG